MKLKSLVGVLLPWMALSPLAAALEGDPYANETPAQRDERMAWWREAKFGMFIHWGIYAVPAGTYQDERIGGYGEWIMRNGKIPLSEYRAFAKDFTAQNHDPKAWVALAKEAGMRYMVITSKHHDGFALFPTKASNWNVIEATPHHNDLIGPLAGAARAEGLKFGLYYSQSQDWMHPGGAIYGYKEGDVICEDHKGGYDEYLQKIAVPQVREILTTYQPDVLWWDTPLHMTPERARPLAELLKLRPGIIHNNRLGGGYKGDTETPEQFIPPTGFPGQDWETCMTMNKSWGFKSFDDNWKPASTLITNLVDVVSKGGNYLLNVGPDATGRIPEPSVKLLKQVGAWMKVNGEAVYGSQASPFKRLTWGRCTVKPAADETLLYLHVFDWNAEHGVLLPGLENEVKSAVVLATGTALEVEGTEFGPRVRLKGKAPDEVSSTIKLRLAGKLKVKALPVIPDPDGVIRLTPLEADLQGKGLKLGQRRGKEIVTNWDSPDETVSWDLQVTDGGKYGIRMTTAADKEGAVIRVEGMGKFACAVPKTEDPQTFATTGMGEVTLKKGQRLKIRLKPVADGWKPVNFHSLELAPLP